MTGIICFLGLLSFFPCSLLSHRQIRIRQQKGHVPSNTLVPPLCGSWSVIIFFYFDNYIDIYAWNVCCCLKVGQNISIFFILISKQYLCMKHSQWFEHCSVHIFFFLLIITYIFIYIKLLMCFEHWSIVYMVSKIAILLYCPFPLTEWNSDPWPNHHNIKGPGSSLGPFVTAARVTFFF